MTLTALGARLGHPCGARRDLRQGRRDRSAGRPCHHERYRAQPAITDTIPPDGKGGFSIESLPEFDADVVIATCNIGWGNDLPAERDSDLSVPGFCKTIDACRVGQMVSIPRHKAFSMSFDALGLSPYAVLALIAGQDITARAD